MDRSSVHVDGPSCRCFGRHHHRCLQRNHPNIVPALDPPTADGSVMRPLEPPRAFALNPRAVAPRCEHATRCAAAAATEQGGSAMSKPRAASGRWPPPHCRTVQHDFRRKDMGEASSPARSAAACGAANPGNASFALGLRIVGHRTAPSGSSSGRWCRRRVRAARITANGSGCGQDGAPGFFAPFTFLPLPETPGGCWSKGGEKRREKSRRR
jgi:hypothetical protein